MSTRRRVIQDDDISSDHDEQYHSVEEDVGEGDLDGSETSWNWASRMRLVVLVEQHGKNWGSLLKKLHDEHLISSIVESDKLRVQFNSLNSSKSAFRQPFKKKAFKCPSKDPKTNKKLTSEQKELLKQEHDIAEDQRKADHKKIHDLLDKIHFDELKAMKGRGKKRTISEVNDDIDEAEQSRQRVKFQRNENARRFAERQEHKERLFLTLLEKSITALDSSNFLIKKLCSDIYPTQPFVPDRESPCLNNNRSSDEDLSISEELFTN